MSRNLVVNVVALYVIQFANYVLPLAAIPFLLRVVGPGPYGLIAFSQAVVQYFVVLTDYGFNFSATREVSIHRHDMSRLSAIFSSVLAIKFCLMLVSAVCLAAMIRFVPQVRDTALLCIFSFALVAGNVLFPTWLFQGLELMRIAAMLNVAARAVSLGALFLFVKGPQDAALAALLLAGAAPAAAVCGMVVALKMLPLRLTWPDGTEIRARMGAGWHIFLSSAATSLYTTSNTFLLGLICAPAEVGYYAVAEKIIRTIQGLVVPLMQAVYPHVAAIGERSRHEALSFLHRLTLLQGTVTFLGSLGLLLFALPVAWLAAGAQNAPAVLPIMRVMAFVPFVIGLSNVFGIHVMLNFGLEKWFSRIILGAGLANIVIVIPLAYTLQGVGAGIASLLTEAVITAAMMLVLRRQGLLDALLFGRKVLPG